MSKIFEFIVSIIKAMFAKPIQIEPAKEEIKEDLMPWYTKMHNLIGMNEIENGKVHKLLPEFFKYTSFHTQENQPWCAASLCWALETSNYKSTHSAAAISFINYGEECPLQKGCIVLIEHPNGKHHVHLFDSWHDYSKRIANMLGGNQDNKMCIKKYDFTKEKVLRSCWPIKRQ